jgi:hypothetical protein
MCRTNIPVENEYEENNLVYNYITLKNQINSLSKEIDDLKKSINCKITGEDIW